MREFLMLNSNQPGGYLLVNKPSGPTSHDIVGQLRKITGIKKIGHAGTLDPFASGLLMVAVGREATKGISRFVRLDKEYTASLRLGEVSDTYDRTGMISRGLAKPEVLKAEIEAIIRDFSGAQMQIPPMFSAKKVGGRKLYELARKGIAIEREPVPINVYGIELLSYQWPSLKIKVKCSSGTYIRSLAGDIGARLGCGAYLEELKRTAIGRYRLEDSYDPESISEANWAEISFWP